MNTALINSWNVIFDKVVNENKSHIIVSPRNFGEVEFRNSLLKYYESKQSIISIPTKLTNSSARNPFQFLFTQIPKSIITPGSKESENITVKDRIDFLNILDETLNNIRRKSLVFLLSCSWSYNPNELYNLIDMFHIMLSTHRKAKHLKIIVFDDFNLKFYSQELTNNFAFSEWDYFQTFYIERIHRNDGFEALAKFDCKNIDQALNNIGNHPGLLIETINILSARPEMNLDQLSNSLYDCYAIKYLIEKFSGKIDDYKNEILDFTKPKNLPSAKSIHLRELIRLGIIIRTEKALSELCPGIIRDLIMQKISKMYRNSSKNATSKVVLPIVKEWWFVSLLIGIISGGITSYILGSFNSFLIVSFLSFLVVFLKNPRRRFYRMGYGVIGLSALNKLPDFEYKLFEKNYLFHFKISDDPQIIGIVSMALILLAALLFWFDYKLDKNDQ
ncbi:hypothetical protein QQ008_13175 [Fulvivirgaceae bacterium BMA10]|uniref:Uncharacterized protein n=1 Tax=Splendidivirga corallicola TaxID=3051826 RepID=A0ABT8KNP7_9BACT|nr:hypothetical protein [Fulvivirgaceae bacterium BMA10]